MIGIIINRIFNIAIVLGEKYIRIVGKYEYFILFHGMAFVTSVYLLNIRSVTLTRCNKNEIQKRVVYQAQTEEGKEWKVNDNFKSIHIFLKNIGAYIKRKLGRNR